MKDYEKKALLYAEEHGIINYVVIGSKMIYYANYPAYLAEPRKTYKVVVNLKVGKEESRVMMKKWYRAGNHNMYK